MLVHGQKRLYDRTFILVTCMKCKGETASLIQFLSELFRGIPVVVLLVICK